MTLRHLSGKLLLLAAVSATSVARGGTPTRPITDARGGGAARATVAATRMATAVAADGREAYIVVFRDAPALDRREAVAGRLAALPADLDSKIAAIRGRQDRFAADMRSRIGDFASGARYARVLNGMAVLVPSGALPQLQADPRVRAVYPVRKYALLLDASNPLMGAPAFWTSLGGDSEAGKGVKIADLDTGVDFSNPMFSDPSLAMPDGFPKENDGNSFANSKVIVAKYFQGIIDANDPALSPSQRTAQDLSGHGSHTASVAAGAKVALSGDGRRPVTLEGVAPKAYIGDYKVFSPGAYSDNIIAAIEAATADGMNVLNMSFGLADGNGNEPFLYSAAAENEAIQNAIAAGVTITVAAGNTGQDASGNANPDSISSTADVPEVIAVGASTNAHTGLAASVLAQISMKSGHTPPPDDVTNIIGSQADHTDSRGNSIPFPTSPFSAAFADWDALDGSSDGEACVALPGPGLPLSGQVVLIQRGTCTFEAKVQNAQNAGARAVVIYNKADGSDGGDQILLISTGVTSIPAIFVERTDGLNLKTYLDANGGNPPSATGTFGPAPPGSAPLVSATPSRELASFSSIGPTIDLQIKPDLTSIGTGSYAAVQDDSALGDGRFHDDEVDPSPFYDPSGFAFGQGTSFSAPRTAGGAALVKQKHPDWTPAEIKAALMETSARPTSDSDALQVGNLSVQERGSGDVDLSAASRVGSIVLPASYSYRRVAFNTLPDAHALDRTFTLENKTNAPVTYALSAAATAGRSDPAIVPSVAPATLTVPAHGTAPFTLSLALGSGLHSGQNDSEGRITVSDGGTSIPDVLSIPYWIRLAFPAGSPPVLESATSAYVAAQNELDVEMVAHDADADLAGLTLDFYDAAGELLGSFSDTFADIGVDVSSPDLDLDLQITSFAGDCPGCVSIGVTVTDAAGNASNTIVSRFGNGVTTEAVPDASDSTFTRSIPLVAHIQGAQFPFRSDVRLVNPDPAHILTIDAFFVAEGGPSTSALHVAHQLLPRQSFALDDMVTNDFGLKNTAGSLVLVSEDGHPFLASSRAFTQNADGGSFGTFAGSLPSAGGVGPGDAAAIANGIPTTAGYHTNVGITEVSGTTTRVRVQGFDASGASVGTYDETIPAWSNVQRNPATDPAHGFSARAARVEFTVLSGGRVLPYAATVDENSGDTLLSIGASTPESGDDVIVAGAGHIPGGGNTLFTSDLSVTNGSTGPRMLTFTLIPSAALGSLPPPPAPVSIAAGQTLLYADVFPTLFGFGGNGVAGIRIHPDSPTRLAASVLTSTPNAGGGGSYGFFVNGTSGAEAIAAGG
ncbi:MAG TPA: S8 family serine peptidase, partial [Thermoanaerobaculia bacterium]|nr:S8 family serine peptidase [Thermoanaerobaculia bacterium]